MTNFIPIFPLSIVVFPGESLNLHVFEPRYKQLINECIKDKKPFGIPIVLNDHMEEYGMLIEVDEMVKEYESGEMDVKTKAIKVFRILQTIDAIPEKLYSGAIVSYPDNIMQQGDTAVAQKVLTEVMRLYTLLNVEEKFPSRTDNEVSYRIGHFIGLTRQQEYELLCIFTELQRLEYVRRHLTGILPIIKELEQMKARIQMNGHFRNLSLDGDK